MGRLSKSCPIFQKLPCTDVPCSARAWSCPTDLALFTGGGSPSLYISGRINDLSPSTPLVTSRLFLFLKADRSYYSSQLAAVSPTAFGPTRLGGTSEKSSFTGTAIQMEIKAALPGGATRVLKGLLLLSVHLTLANQGNCHHNTW